MSRRTPAAPPPPRAHHQHGGYAVSQRIPPPPQEAFLFFVVAGTVQDQVPLLRPCRLVFIFTAAAYNLVRLPKLDGGADMSAPAGCQLAALPHRPGQSAGIAVIWTSAAPPCCYWGR